MLKLFNEENKEIKTFENFEEMLRYLEEWKKNSLWVKPKGVISGQFSQHSYAVRNGEVTVFIVTPNDFPDKYPEAVNIISKKYYYMEF